MLALSHLVTALALLLLIPATVATGYIWWLWARHTEPRPKFWLMTSVVVTSVWGCALYLALVGVGRYFRMPTEWLPLGRAIVAVVLLLVVIWTARYVHETRRHHG